VGSGVGVWVGVGETAVSIVVVSSGAAWGMVSSATGGIWHAANKHRKNKTIIVLKWLFTAPSFITMFALFDLGHGFSRMDADLLDRLTNIRVYLCLSVSNFLILQKLQR
jgi:hypothetical protein